MKRCCKCKEEKQLEEFSINSMRKDGHQSVCKKCRSIFDKKRHQNPIEKTRVRDKNNEMRARNIQFINNYLLEHPCIDCGEKDTVVLQFDHVRGSKKGNVSEMSQRGFGLTTIIEEIAKCEVRCANCHIRQTFNRRHNGV